jgi:hypothetical protein
LHCQRHPLSLNKRSLAPRFWQCSHLSHGPTVHEADTPNHRHFNTEDGNTLEFSARLAEDALTIMNHPQTAV